MLDRVLEEIIGLGKTTDGLLQLVSRLSRRPLEDLERELNAHLALRAAFLLIGEVDGASNYTVASNRLRARLGDQTPERLAVMLAGLMSATTHIETGTAAIRASLESLPYPDRSRILKQQGGRCAVCGWRFGETAEERSDEESRPTLDHRVPYLLGGDTLDNLWILCRLCNSVKQARLHVGEHGPVWVDNHVYHSRLRSVGFWVLARDRCCFECRRSPAHTRLFVVRSCDSGPWVFDNCIAVCQEHRGAWASIDY